MITSSVRSIREPLVDDLLLSPDELDAIINAADEFLCTKGEDPYLAAQMVGVVFVPANVPDVATVIKQPDPALRFAMGCILLQRQITAISAIIAVDDLHRQFRSRWTLEPDESSNYGRTK